MKSKNRRTIEFSDLKRLAFCNSRKLPAQVEVHGRRMRWVGIGWVDEGKADGTEVLVVDNKPKTAKARKAARK